jgi:hypothetical protein
MLNSFLFNEVIPNTAVPPSYHHYCIDGSYRTLSRNVNHSFVIARDENYSFLFGEDTDETELSLVGERLDFKLLQALNTEEEAESAAEALQMEARLNTVRGYILIAPNCGVEVWDVIRIYDSVADQNGVDFRVSGITLIWNPAGSYYSHKLFLCAL